MDTTEKLKSFGSTETMSPTEALLWLCSLEKPCPCPECHGNPVVDTWGCQGKRLCCHGTGKVPVLPELREPCPCPNYPAQTCEPCWQYGTHPHAFGQATYCRNCQGRNWRPRQGRDALHDAMHKDGWDYLISQVAAGRGVSFYKQIFINAPLSLGEDAADDLAAVKAMKAAGYLV